MDTRSISAKNVGISGLKTIPTNCPGVLGKKNIQAVLFVGKRCMCIMIVNTTSTILARTGSAGTPFLYQSLQLFQLFGKTDFKRMRYPVHVILMALTMFYLGKNSFRNIALILRTVMNIQVSHTTISNWCTRFAPMFQNIAIQLIPALNFNSDEWHADETVVKIQGEKYYLWLILDSETRFVLGFHLDRHRDSPQAFTILEAVKPMGTPQAIVSDRYFAYQMPVKTLHGVQHIRVKSFHDDITNNLIECFNKQFKAWYKTKQGFSSFASANNLISMFIFFYNFVRPHSALNNLTPAQCAGLRLSKKRKREFLLVA